MFDHIKCLFHVHKTAENFIIVSEEVTYAFYYKSCAHCGAAVLLVANCRSSMPRDLSDNRITIQSHIISRILRNAIDL